MALRPAQVQAQLASYRAARKREAALFAARRRRDRVLMVAAVGAAVAAIGSIVNAIAEVNRVLP